MVGSTTRGGESWLLKGGAGRKKSKRWGRHMQETGGERES